LPSDDALLNPPDETDEEYQERLAAYAMGQMKLQAMIDNVAKEKGSPRVETAVERFKRLNAKHINNMMI